LVGGKNAAADLLHFRIELLSEPKLARAHHASKNKWPKKNTPFAVFTD
jgi:hypothetical protein